MLFSKAFLSVLLIGSVLIVQGPSASVHAAEPVCEEALTTVEMLQCAGARFEKADRELNRVYQELMAGLDDARRRQLRAVQKAWLAFRDAQAQFEGGAAEGGSLKPILELSARAALTEQRTEQLKTSPR